MSEPATLLPRRRPDLLIRPLGEPGQYVVKDPRTGAYFQIGTQEHFLLTQLNDDRAADDVCTAFRNRFGQLLATEELDEFLGIARAQGFFRSDEATRSRQPLRREQSFLYWRKALFDPHRLFSWLAPRIGFFWTRGFLFVSAGCIIEAAFIAWAHRGELASSATRALHWETAGWTWLVLSVVTLLHESAHGLTCEHHGGEVHEVGFLLLFFLPCFYCNVSDAWLLPRKAQRLWVSFAGGYFELFVWALAVFAWRLALPGTLPHNLAFIVVSVCGVKTLFNFNPLLKLDGYYLASDWLEVPNLQQRALDRFRGLVRRLLWGGPRPGPDPRGRLLVAFGATTLGYSLAFLTTAVWGLIRVAGGRWGGIPAAGAALLGVVAGRNLFRGCFGGEVRAMIASRPVRTVGWLLAISGTAAGLCLIEIDDRAGGTFRLRPVDRAEVRAPVAALVVGVYRDEGDAVSPGAVVALLEVPDLAARLAEARAEVQEAEAGLRLVESGPRLEDVDEQRGRVERAAAWRDLAQRDLDRARRAADEDLARLDRQVAARRAERDAAHDRFLRAKSLAAVKALADEAYHGAEGNYLVAEAWLAESQAAHRAAKVKGAVEAEVELARRDRELADVRATLRLLTAGPRPEEVEAARARLARLREQLHRLEVQEGRQAVVSPAAGTVTTSRLREKVGQFLRQGDLICTVDEPAIMEAEIALSEQDAARVRTGQVVELKARADPFGTLAARVDRVAPAAGRGDGPSTVIAYCRLALPTPDLRPEMTGYARVTTGRKPVGAILADRVLRYVRTEFWW
jgi:multidrug resistance efflux pump